MSNHCNHMNQFNCRNTFPLLMTVGNTFPLVITVENTFPLVITVENTFPFVITVGDRLPLVITVENTFPLLITVGKNIGSSFFLKKLGTSEMSSMGHRTYWNRWSALYFLMWCRKNCEHCSNETKNLSH